MKAIGHTVRAMNLRRLLLAVLLLVSSSGLVLAQDPNKDDSDDRELTISPNPVVFRCTPVGTSDTMVIVVSNPATGRRVVIDRYEAKSPHFILPRTRNVVLQPGTSRRDTIIFAPQSPSSAGVSHRAEIRIDHSSGNSEFDVMGEATPPAKLAIRPDTLFFDMEGPGDVEEQCFSFGHPSCEPVVITRVDVNPASFDVRYRPALPDTIPGLARREICIRYTAGPLSSKGMLKIQTADGDVYDIPLLARPKPRSDIEVTPQPVVFDNVPANSISDPIVVRVADTAAGPPGERIVRWELVGRDSSEFTVVPPTIPFDLRPRSATVANFTVRFAPRDSGLHTAELVLFFQAPHHPIRVQLKGNALGEVVHINRREIDAGDVIVGDTARLADTLVIRNSGSIDVDITHIEFTGGDSSHFKVIGSVPATITPSGTAGYDIEFIPDSAREYEADALVRLSNGGIIPVKLRGGGDTRPPIERRIWVDSNRAFVNTPFDLTVHVSPAFTAADSVTKFQLVFKIDYNALFPHGPLSQQGANDTLYYLSPDTVVIERLSGPVITGTELLSINLEGLVTGQALNTVELIDVQFPGRNVSISTGNGSVQLDGCDVGSGLGFNRPIRAHRAWPVPAREDVTISYTAPEGSKPRVRVVDLMGRAIRESELEKGSGSEQRMAITTDGLAPGTYFVELHAGSEMSVVRVIVGE